MGMLFAILCGHPYGELVMNRMSVDSKDPAQFIRADAAYNIEGTEKAFHARYRDNAPLPAAFVTLRQQHPVTHFPPSAIETAMFRKILYPMTRIDATQRYLPDDKDVYSVFSL